MVGERFRLLLVDAGWFTPLLLFALATVIRLINLDRSPDYDELYHVLAARGWLIDGVPRIADGVYSRAELFTTLVAGFFHAFGESLAVARLPSVLADGLLIAAVFAWTRSVAGSRAAWVAALLLCFAALSIQIAQFARFYALQGLAFWLAAIGVYALATEEERRSWLGTTAIAAGSVLCLLLALDLQITTLMGLAGLLLWLATTVVMPWLLSQRCRPRVFWGSIAAIAVSLAAFALIGFESGFAAELWSKYRESHALQFIDHQSEFWFYHLLMLTRYPTLWTIFPFLVFIALSTNPRPTFFCLCVFLSVFVLLSFAGMKSQRFLVFALPFLFVIWGIALASVLTHVLRFILSAVDGALAGTAPVASGRPARSALVGLGLLFLIGSNGEWTKTALLLGGITLRSEEAGLTLRGEQQSAVWAAAAPSLRPLVETAPVVVTTRDLFSLYYLGRHDIGVSPVLMSQLRDSEEFSLDPRTGRPLISKADSLERILDCYRGGLFITDRYYWRNPPLMSDNIAEVIESRVIPIDLPAAPGVRAFRWQRPNGTVPAYCASLPKLGPTVEDARAQMG
jgi:4-amino-4-deoxy-L-arabinose transferase-like glycosyltransferase